MDLRCISDKGGGGRVGTLRLLGWVVLLGRWRGWCPAQERPGRALPEFCVPTGSERGRGQAAREQRLCKSGEGASLRALASSRWQRNGAGGAACTQRYRSGQKRSQGCQERASGSGGWGQQDPHWWQLGMSTGQLEVRGHLVKKACPAGMGRLGGRTEPRGPGSKPGFCSFKLW